MDPQPAPVLLLPDEPSTAADGDDVEPPVGWRVHRGFDLPTEPWDLGPRRLLCVGTVVDEASARAAIEAVARGAGVALRLACHGSTRHRFLEDLHKIAAPVPYDPSAPPTTDDLDPLQRSLLDALARGTTVTAAAQDLHVSRRTANRLLADVRAKLGVDSNAAAVRAHLAERPAPDA